MPASPPTLDEVRAAAERIAPFARRTAVETCSTLSQLAGRDLRFKAELFQKAGAFKFRGACNAVMKLPPAAAGRGVATQSSGNHGQAIALAAKLRGVPAHVVMPDNSSRAKISAVREYGANVILCGPTLKDREATVEMVAADTGASYLPPYNHTDVIAGQGTVALEFLDQAPDLDAIVAPVGGGGLISGICVAARALKPDIRIFAGEPAGADDALRSKRAGELIPQTGPKTIADGLRASLGDLTWPFIRDEVEAVIAVTEEEIVHAMRLVWERAKLMIEPSSAVAVAAVLSEEFRSRNGLQRVGVVLTGGNVDLESLPW
ncbi:MAG TPA: serine dehydratase [Verrucomicrobiales bacterium]|nr:serine dehydratase [Verrucomicrobiales bacterium]